MLHRLAKIFKREGELSERIGSKRGVSRCIVFGALIIACSPGCETRSPAEGHFRFLDHVNEAETDFDRTALRSIRNLETLSASMTLPFGPQWKKMGIETRSSLAPIVPSRVTFTVRVPSNPTLTFAVGVSTFDDVVPLPILFRVLVDAGEGEQQSFRRLLPPEEHNRWLPQRVDLSSWSGRTVRLSFDTSFGRAVSAPPDAGRRVLPLWANPVLNGGARDEKPNLVLISIDCLRADHVGGYGYARETTPRIDEFAADGVVFQAASSTSSWTLPSHVSMLTGLLPSAHEVVDRWRKIGSSVPYLPERLSKAGYDVNAVVNWVFVSQAYGFERGFNLYRTLYPRTGERVIDDASKILRDGRDRKQFLFVHLFDVHWPYLPPPEFVERFGPRPDDLSDLLDKVPLAVPPSTGEEVEQMVNLYDAGIAFVDQQVGRLLDELKALDLYDKSLIIVTADHGEAFYEHEHWAHNLSLHEEVVRVPLIVKWPENTPSGTSNKPVSIMDIFPTLLEGAGLEPRDTEGVSLLSVVNGEDPLLEERIIVSEVAWAPLGRKGPWPPIVKISLRKGDLKYHATIAADSFSELSEEKLYNLAEDPHERVSLPVESSSEARAFRRWLRDHAAAAAGSLSAAPRRDEEVILDDAAWERLRSLGYIP